MATTVPLKWVNSDGAIVQDKKRKELEKKLQEMTGSTSRDDDLIYDLGNLLAVDPSPIDLQAYEEKKDMVIAERARDNIQLVVNQLFQMPTVSDDDGLFVTLPKITIRTPREKPIPKPKKLTKWEEYKKKAGLHTREKEKLVYDKATDEFKPRFGKDRANTIENDWLIPAKANDEIGTDPWMEKRKLKKQTVDFNKKNQVKNLKRAGKAPQLNVSSSLGLDSKYIKNSAKSGLSSSYDIASISTASMGKFDKKMSKAPMVNTIKFARKESSISQGNDVHSENENAKKVLNRVLKVQGQRKQQVSGLAALVHQKTQDRERRKQKKVHLLAKREEKQEKKRRRKE